MLNGPICSAGPLLTRTAGCCQTKPTVPQGSQPRGGVKMRKRNRRLQTRFKSESGVTFRSRVAGPAAWRAAARTEVCFCEHYNPAKISTEI